MHFSYFSKNSTQEILDEIYPKLYPLDTGKICGAFDLLSIFLNPMRGYELWLDDFINLWNTYHNPSWNEVMMMLFHYSVGPMERSRTDFQWVFAFTS